MDELDSLREEISKIDDNIALLLSLRLKYAREIGRVKRLKGMAIRDEEREGEVLSKWEALAVKYGIPHQLVNEILSKILQYSRASQVLPRRKVNVTLVGYGGMAKSISSLLSFAGHSVVLTGRNLTRASEAASSVKAVSMPVSEALNWGDYVILAVPPQGLFSPFLYNFYPRLKGKTVMDVSSSKEQVFHKMESLSKEHGFSFISTHPLFGPLPLPIGERIVLIPSSTGVEKLSEVMDFWTEAGLTPVVSNYEEHEKAMAVVQVLPHFFMIALMRSLEDLHSSLGINPEVFSTTNFSSISAILNRIRDNMPTILEIQASNKYSREVREKGLIQLIKVKEELDNLDAIRPEGKGRGT